MQSHVEGNGDLKSVESDVGYFELNAVYSVGRLYLLIFMHTQFPIGFSAQDSTAVFNEITCCCVHNHKMYHSSTACRQEGMIS